MTKLEDLPNELLSRVMVVLGASKTQYDKKRNLSALKSVCRVSKRFCELARAEIYSKAHFNHGPTLVHYFYESGITKCPSGTLRKIYIVPNKSRSFHNLEAVAKRLQGKTSPKVGLSEQMAKSCGGVTQLKIDLLLLEGNMGDNNAEFFLPILKAINPEILDFDTVFAPTDGMTTGRSIPIASVKLSALVDAFASYTRLKTLALPTIHFDRIGKKELDLLARLPLEYIHLAWPTGLSPKKLFDIIGVLPKVVKKGLVVECRASFIESEGDQYGPDGYYPSESLFRRKNAGFTLTALEAYFKEKEAMDQLEKINWRGPLDEKEKGYEFNLYQDHQLKMRFLRE